MMNESHSIILIIMLIIAATLFINAIVWGLF